MTVDVRLPTGAVRQVFTPDGKLIKSPEEFENEGKYICCGAEKLKQDLSMFSLSHSLYILYSLFNPLLSIYHSATRLISFVFFSISLDSYDI